MRGWRPHVRHEVLGGRQVALIGLGLLAASAACASPGPVSAGVNIAPAAPQPTRSNEEAPAKARPARSRQGDAPPIEWLTSEPDARERARKAQLPLLIFVKADWSTASLMMERKTWIDPAVRAAAQGLVALRLDFTDTDGTPELLSKKYGVEVVPMTLVIDPKGGVRQMEGYRLPGEVVKLLRESE